MANEVIPMRQHVPRLVAGLQALCKQLQQKGLTHNMVEIGSYTGESTAIFGACMDSVLAVDRWCIDPTSTDAAAHHNGAYIRKLYVDRTHDIAAIRTMHMTSAEAAKLVPDSSLDFVYIDGDHTYEGVTDDIRLWLSKVKPGGMIGGHDYANSKHPGVQRAVTERWDREQITTYADNSWSVAVDAQYNLPRPEVLVVCDDTYLPFLELTYPLNKPLGKWLVVTELGAVETQTYCARNAIRYVLADHRNAPAWNTANNTPMPYVTGYNHGYMINQGLQQLRQDDWVILLDSDIVLPVMKVIQTLKAANKEHIVTASRLQCPTMGDWERARAGEHSRLTKMVQGLGSYFMGIYPSAANFGTVRQWYPQQWGSQVLANDNVILRMYTAIKAMTTVPAACIHLGPEGTNSGDGQKGFWDATATVKLEMETLV